MAPLPTVGGIIHYKTRGSADGVFPPTDFAAIITRVHDETTVDLVTFGPSGIRFETSVVHGTNPGNWTWPPRV